MSKKNLGKHGRTTSQSKARTLHAMSIGAAGALVGASLALGVTPGGTPLAHADSAPTTPTPATAQPQAQAPKPSDAQGNSAKPDNPQKKDTPKADQAKADATNDATKAAYDAQRSKAPNASTLNAATNPVPVTNFIAKADKGANAKAQDREATNDPGPQAKPDQGPQANNEITLSKETKDTLPNMYAWGSSDNTYIEKGQNQAVTFKFAKPSDGSTITKVAIFPSDGNTVDNAKSRRFLEYYSDAAAVNEHQPYSGTYEFKVDTDGTATLTMTKLYRNGNLKSGESYSANRCIYVYGTDKNGNTVVLYKTNIVRAATLIPPKTAGSIVLKYNEELTAQQIQDKLKAALDAPTEATGKKSIREQIKAASTANGVGVRNETAKTFTNTPDTAENKVIINDQRAYTPTDITNFNTKPSGTGDTEKTYTPMVRTIKTHLITDTGYTSDDLPLTIARYDDRIDKPIVEDTDPSKVSDEVKTEIKKKLAKLNHVTQDKVSINNDGTFTINFDGVDPNDAPKIALRDLVLKKLEEKDITVPANDKATVIYNPLGYSKAELARIKQSIIDANKNNTELALTSPDQITLEYITGDTVTSGHGNQGISNGQAENKITVKIKTDKAYAEFTSDVKQNKLTRLVDIRKDYDVSWDKTKNKLDGRDSDEGLSWSNDSHTTIIYRYDPTAAKELKTDDIIKLLNATPKKGADGKNLVASLRDLTGGEALDHEDTNGKPRKSHMHYALQNDEPTGELSLGNMSGAYWIGNQKVSHSDEKLGDNLSEAGSYSWDTEAGSVTVAGKKDKIYKARLFVQPYAMSYYKDVYLEKGRNPGNTAKAINIIFVPQTNHKTSDLKTSVEGHKTVPVEGKDVPTQSEYYNASDKKKEAYDKALETAKTLYESVKDTDESKLTEDQKAQIDNATINLDKARAELDGAKTNKDPLTQSIEEDGKPDTAQQAGTGTQASDKYKNVSDPSFVNDDGTPDTKKNAAAQKAKADYDKALEHAKELKDDDNATQKAVDAAKANLDAARAKLNDFTTNKDELNAAIAEHGQVKDGRNAQGAQTLTNADPAYQNATKEEREAYDNAVKKAKDLSADPNASQKDVNAAIDALQKAKAALDLKATDKSQLITAEKLTFDNPDKDDASKQSTFYKNALNKQTNGANEQEKQAAKDAVDNYNNALAKAREVLKNDKATQKEVDDAKEALTNAEKALHDNYATDANELTKVLADNFSGYLMPAYFNAFDKAQAGDADAKKAFKDYNDAYQKAKKLKEDLEKAKNGGTAPSQNQIDEAKKALEEARKVIDKYATNTSRLSAAVFNDLAIQNSPAYANVKELADKQNPSEEEKAQVEAAKKAKEAYEAAVAKLNQALNKQMPKDQADGKDIPDTNTPVKDGNLDDKDYLKNIQAHAQGEPLDRDIDAILKEMNEAVADLNKHATKTDELLKSVNEDDATKQTPAYKNASIPVFQKADSADADADKNAKAKQAVDKYGEMLNKAKDLLKDPNATQAQINEAKKNLDDARKTLLGDPKDQANTPGFNTDITKLQKSVDKHGKDAEGANPAVEGTKDSDAYRNASDPHFVDENGKPDEAKNQQARDAKTAYDKALTDAQELIAKHNDANTPQDAKPTQKEINDALDALDKARTKLDAYKTDTTKLDEEAKKSTADGGTLADTDFESTPEFKNADDKKAEGNKDAASDVKAYKDALKKARDLVKAATSTDPNTKNSERPTQQEVNEALDALKAAKKQITDNYKTNLEPLTSAKDFANGDFKKTPEYKNAAALKDNQEADADKKEAAKKAVEALDDTVNNSALKKAMDIIANPTGKTQKEVDDALDALKKAMKTVTDGYPTKTDELKNEVGDKDKDGKDVIPPFEASVTYKNALNKQNSGDADAIAKLKAYADQLEAAQKLINQVKNPDPNAKPEDRPTQKKVDDALAALKQAKKDIDDNFKTNAKDLKKETNELKDDGQPKDEKEKFENSTEFKNASAKKGEDGKDIEDVQTYKAALEKANKLLGKFDKDGNPKPGEKDIPTQQEVDDAQKALKEIKDKILANYKTSSTPLQMEVDKSKDGKDDKRDDVFENTPAFKNADAVKGEDGKDNPDIKRYKEALDAAKALLDKFDRTTGKPKTPPAGEKAPTQKQLDDALKALTDAKNAIKKYATNAKDLEHEIDNGFTSTQPYQNVLASWGAADISKNPYVAKYLEALNAAKAVLDRHKGNYDEAYKPTQQEVNEALAKLKLAEKELSDAYNEPHAFLDPQTYGNTPSGGGAGGAGGAVGANTGEAGNAGAHDANKQNEGAHANHDANHNTNTNVHQPQHAAHNNANADANANAAANANVAADALGTGAAQAPDGSKAGKDTNINNARLPKTSDALPLYANSAAVLVAIAVLTRTNRRRKKNRL